MPGRPPAYDFALIADFLRVVTPIALGLLFLLPMVIAWRWVLTTAAIFGALVAINYAYVQWLEPLAKHH
jgi:hypothetical protein